MAKIDEVLVPFHADSRHELEPYVVRRLYTGTKLVWIWKPPNPVGECLDLVLTS
jgi:hypothetical protein